MIRPIIPAADRSARLERLRLETFDVLVIGGGITGAGVARDAAMRGLRTAMIEQADFASGTSSRSSRLVHGGVRYLEQGHLSLVFESSRERRTLLRIAPHLVRPLPFVWPVYQGARVSRWMLSAALTLYDALALFRNVGRHERLSARGVLDCEPTLAPAHLLGGARYWDAATDDARLTLATVRSAAGAGAVAMNHLRATGFVHTEGRIAGATAVDALGGGSAKIRARTVVNATGPWSDLVEGMAHNGSVPRVRGSKGVHVSVPRSRMGNVSAITLTSPRDGRVMFVLPAGAFAIIGTTDTFVDVRPESVCASEDDVEYLLEAANHYFPHARLAPRDVVSAWAGIRPLAAGTDDVATPSSASREHAIVETHPGLIQVTGGKLTTYRSMASEVVDMVQRVLGERRRPSRTADQPLVGGDLSDLAAEVARATRIVRDADIAERLVRAYGSDWRAVWALADATASLGERITAGAPYLMAELAYAVHHEYAMTLGDLLIRRVPLAFETPDHGRSVARRVVGAVADWLGWTEDEAQAAVGQFDAEVALQFTITARSER